MATSPDNKNFLSPIGFQFVIQKLPHVNYFCTAASVPSVSTNDIDTPTPFIRLPQPGDKLQFGTLDLAFRIDEDMQNYREIYNWLVGINPTDTFNQRIPLLRAGASATESIYSDASLIVLTNQYKPNIEIKFTDVFPTSLSSFEFNIEQADVEYLNASVTFTYRKYDLLTVS
jgi:hypothetical protein